MPDYDDADMAAVWQDVLDNCHPRDDDNDPDDDDGDE
jgi:hypothetical protein